MKDKEAPIEQYYPISQVNEIANKESKAKKHYRPPLIMHKWWARRLGCVFRSMLLYSLADEEMSVADNKTDLSSWNQEEFDFKKYRNDPEKLWDDFYLKDFEFDKRILDPFMGGGTTVLEGVRTNSEVIGKDLSPVAWFNVKKQIEPVDKEDLEERLGFSVEDLTDSIRRQLNLESTVNGVIVSEIDQTSRAYRQGLQRGDVISQVSGNPVTSPDEFYGTMRSVIEEGTEVLLLRVNRQGNNMFVAFEL